MAFFHDNSTTMMARLQQFWILSSLLGLAVWLRWAWPYSPAGALIGVALVWLWWALLVGWQLHLMQRANRSDAAAPARTGQLWRAGAAEMVAVLRVFGWQQPFRSRAVPDWLPAPAQASGQRGVVLVHGLWCNRGAWNAWLAPLRARGHAFVAVNLEPVLGPIDGYAPLIEAAVQRVTQATGQAPVVICHSLGGLAVRAWLRAYQASQSDARVHRVLTLGSPHGGTELARYSRTALGQQMRPGSDWLRALERSEPAQRATRFDCWYSNCDNIVFPASTALLAGARGHFIAGVSHVQMLTHAPLIQACLASLEAQNTQQKPQPL